MNATTKCVTLAIVAVSHAGPVPVPWHLYIHHSLLDIRYSNPHGNALSITSICKTLSIPRSTRQTRHFACHLVYNWRHVCPIASLPPILSFSHHHRDCVGIRRDDGNCVASALWRRRLHGRDGLQQSISIVVIRSNERPVAVFGNSQRRSRCFRTCDCVAPGWPFNGGRYCQRT